MDKLLARAVADFPSLEFVPGTNFAWSPKTQSIVYKKAPEDSEIASWSLFHELAHALLNHDDYDSDFELLKIEVAAWEKAKELANNYNTAINEDHIQDCLDTYRDWLYQRSTCPSCTACSLQINKFTYNCLNCDTSWKVSGSKHCRPYRLTK